MSKPENPLAKFRTYSAHHILAVTNGAGTAELLSANNQLYDRASNNPESKYDLQLAFGDVKNRYVIISDSRRDTEFYIKDLKWKSTLVPFNTDDGKIYSDTSENEGEIIIEEPLGAELLRVLVDTTTTLRVASGGLVFVVKTIFTGYDAMGNLSTIDNIKPILFTVHDLKVVMDSGGARYTLSIYGTTNGVSKLPQISTIAEATVVKVPVGSTMGSALKALEAEINRKYIVTKEELQIALNKDKGDGEEVNLEQNFRDVTYVINCDKIFNSAPYLMGLNEPTDDLDDSNTVNIKCASRASVEDCIREVIGSCEQMAKDATKDDADGRRFSYKIITRLKPSNEAYVVEYLVKRFENIFKTPTEDLNLDDEKNGVTEFDYIYTGKNTDVMRFDMHMDMGMSFFHTMVVQQADGVTQEQQRNGIKTGFTAGSGAENPASGDEEKVDPVDSRAPLFLGMTIKNNDLTYRPNPLTTASFDQLLHRQASLENTQVSMEIIGNPDLMNEMMDSSADFDLDAVDSSGKPLESSAASRKYTVSPLIKLNIKYPENKNLTGVKPFWFQGYFTIFQIEHKFESGVFTQEVHMLSVMESIKGDETLASQEPAQIEAPKPAGYDANLESKSTESAAPETKIAAPPVIIGPQGSSAKIHYKSTLSKANIDVLDDEIKDTFATIVAVWEQEIPGLTPVVTSGLRGDPKTSSSLHAKKRAIDVRGNNIVPGSTSKSAHAAKGKKMRQILHNRLNADGHLYDILYETHSQRAPFAAYDLSNYHFHIEYDPKRERVSPVDDEDDIDG